MPLVSFCSPYSIIKTRWSRFVDYCPNLHCQWGSLRQEILTPSFFKFLGCSVVGMKSCRLKWFPEVGTLNGPKGKVTFDSEAQFPPEVLSLNMPPLNAAIDLRGVKVSFVPPSVNSCKMRRRVGLKPTDVGINEWLLPRLGLHRSMKSAATARKCCVSNSRACIRPLSPRCRR